MKLAAIILALALAQVSEASFSPSFRDESKSIQRLKLKIDLDCNDLEAAWDSRYEAFMIYDAIDKRTFDQYLVNECEKVKANLTRYLGDVHTCLSSRDVSKISAGAPVDLIGMGVTNFVKSDFKKIQNATGTNEDMMEKAVKLVHDLTKSLLSDRANRRKIEVDDIYGVSETGSSHSDEVLDIVESSFVPLMSWSSHYMESEMLAGYANLKTIESLCRRGKLATRELAELSGYTELSEIDPDDTQLFALSVDFETNVLDVSFRVKPIDLVGLVCVMVAVFWALLFSGIVIYLKCCRRKKNKQAPYQSPTIQETAWEMSSDLWD